MGTSKQKIKDPLKEAVRSLEKFENSLDEEEKKSGFNTPIEEIIVQMEQFE